MQTLSRVARREINRHAWRTAHACQRPALWRLVRDELLRRVNAGEPLLQILSADLAQQDLDSLRAALSARMKGPA
jgi:hypothetical protein